MSAVHLLCLGTYDTSKPRTRILRNGLRSAGVKLEECHESVWEGVSDKSQVSGLLRRLLLLGRWLSRYPVLIWRFLRIRRPDLVLIGYPGVLDMLVLAPIAKLRGIPVVWDMFMSLYDTVVLDRALLRRNSLFARCIYQVENFAVRLADLVFLDTAAHARRIEAMFHLPAGVCGAVWVGAEVEMFEADPAATQSTNQTGTSLHVLFYGQFIPLHGVDTIIAAANLLRDEPFDWLLIGRGQEECRIRHMLQERPLPRVRWLEWVNYPDLRGWMLQADICLGIFGISEKAASVIPNKVFQTVAAGRPLITRDSPAVQELLRHEPPCVYLVQAGCPEALAGALRQHRAAISSSRPLHCHEGISRQIDGLAVGRQFLQLVECRLARGYGKRVWRQNSQ